MEEDGGGWRMRSLAVQKLRFAIPLPLISYNGSNELLIVVVASSRTL